MNKEIKKGCNLISRLGFNLEGLRFSPLKRTRPKLGIKAASEEVLKSQITKYYK